MMTTTWVKQKIRLGENKMEQQKLDERKAGKKKLGDTCEEEVEGEEASVRRKCRNKKQKKKRDERAFPGRVTGLRCV